MWAQVGEFHCYQANILFLFFFFFEVSKVEQTDKNFTTMIVYLYLPIEPTIRKLCFFFLEKSLPFEVDKECF